MVLIMLFPWFKRMYLILKWQSYIYTGYQKMCPLKNYIKSFLGTIELKPSKKMQEDKSSLFAIFKNSQEAHQAYEKVKGSLEKDSWGRPQKLVKLKLTTGILVSFYVRKMANDDSLGQISSKRA